MLITGFVCSLLSINIHRNVVRSADFWKYLLKAKWLLLEKKKSWQEIIGKPHLIAKG